MTATVSSPTPTTVAAVTARARSGPARRPSQVAAAAVTVSALTASSPKVRLP